MAKFVDGECARQVEGSLLTKLETRHRADAPLGSQADSLLGPGGVSSAGVGRGPWKPSHHASGWFADWWGGDWGDGQAIVSQQSREVW